MRFVILIFLLNVFVIQAGADILIIPNTNGSSQIAVSPYVKSGAYNDLVAIELYDLLASGAPVKRNSPYGSDFAYPDFFSGGTYFKGGAAHASVNIVLASEKIHYSGNTVQILGQAATQLATFVKNFPKTFKAI